MKFLWECLNGLGVLLLMSLTVISAGLLAIGGVDAFWFVALLFTLAVNAYARGRDAAAREHRHQLVVMSAANEAAASAVRSILEREELWSRLGPEIVECAKARLEAALTGTGNEAEGG